MDQRSVPQALRIILFSSLQFLFLLLLQILQEIVQVSIFLGMYLKRWVRTRPIEACTSLFVLAVHLWFVLSFGAQVWVGGGENAPKDPIKVRTFVLAPPKPVPTPVQPVSQVSPREKPKPKPKPKKATPPKEPRQEVRQQKVTNTKQKELLARARASLEKIQLNGHKGSSKEVESVAFQTPQLRVERLTETKEGGRRAWTSYHDEMVRRLQLLLKLPDFGEVQVEVVVDRSGKFQRMRILGSVSGKNRGYIEKELPQVQFPAFGEHFNGEREHTFTLTLRNDW